MFGELAMLADRVAAEHTNLAGIGVQETADQSDQRGLAGSVRANQTEHLTAVDAERQLIDRGGRAVALDYPHKLDRPAG